MHRSGSKSGSGSARVSATAKTKSPAKAKVRKHQVNSARGRLPADASRRSGKTPVYTARDDINIYLLGSSGVGKTTIIRHFVYPEEGAKGATSVVQPRSTISMDLEMVRDMLVPLHATPDHPSATYRVNLRIWDTGGDEAFRSTTKLGLRHADIIIYTFDASEQQPYRSCTALGTTWAPIVAESGLCDRPYVRTPERPDRHAAVYPFFAMMGNKIDLLASSVGASGGATGIRQDFGVPMDVVQEVFEDVTQTPAEQMPVHATMYVSGLRGDSLREGMLYILQSYLQRERALHRLYYVGDGTDGLNDFGLLGTNTRGTGAEDEDEDLTPVGNPLHSPARPRGHIRVIGASNPPAGDRQRDGCCT